MAQYTPPSENVPIFDSSLFNTGDEYLTFNIASTKFLRYPLAQGTETLLTTNINGDLTCLAVNMGGRLIMNGSTDLDRIIRGCYYQIADNTTPFDSNKQMYSNGTNVVFDNNTQGGGYIFATEDVGGGQSLPLSISSVSLTSQCVQPASSNSSTIIPTTAWVQSAIIGGGLKNMWNYQIFNVNTSLTSGTATQIATINTPYPTSNQFGHIIRLEVSYAIFVNGTNTLIPSWALIPDVCSSPNPNTITILDCIFDPSSNSYYPVVAQSTYVNVLQSISYAPPNQAVINYTPIQIGTVIDLGNNIAKLRVTVNCPIITYQISNYNGNLLSFTASIKIVSSQNTTVSPVISSGATAGISYFS